MKPGKALSILAAYNVFQNTRLDKRGYVAGNLVATGLGLVWARRSGLGWRDVGLSRDDARAGLRMGFAIAVAASGVALLLRDRQLMRAMLDDVRLDDVSEREAWFRLLVRFPLGTALFEEVWFRGILPSALRQHGASRPELVSMAAFTAWHLIPTATAIEANAGGSLLGGGQKTCLVFGGSFAAGLGGLGFTAMRKTSASLVAPWLAHATLNGLSFWMAWAHRRSTRTTTSRS
jgi:membrane protease YdiL (CAAX protease family)